MWMEDDLVSVPGEGETAAAQSGAPASVAVAVAARGEDGVVPAASGADGSPRHSRRFRVARVAWAGETGEGLATKALELVDTVVYILVGVCFCGAALYSLGYAAYSFGTQVAVRLQSGQGNWVDLLFGAGKAGQAGQDIITLVSDLLLTLIIMEVLGTVVHHLRDRETTLKPFLFIGIISATRGILAVGARLSVSTDVHITDEFVRDMIELGVNAVVIIALGVAMKLIGPLLEEGATGSGTRRRVAAVTQDGRLTHEHTQSDPA
jgi:uncharacterized membrane protein (DUF373 family)